MKSTRRHDISVCFAGLFCAPNDNKGGHHTAFSYLGSSIITIRLEIMDFHSSSFLETS